LSFARTHDLDIVVSRCTNNYGPHQYPEKLIPLVVTNALDDLPLPLYDGGTQIRDWLRVEDHCDALMLLLEAGARGEIYNLGANQEPERTNAEVTAMILACTGRSDRLIEHRHGLRPGHDQRYAVATEKVRALGWRPQADVEQGIADTVSWYAEHRSWWEKLKSDDYKAFYRSHYGSDGTGSDGPGASRRNSSGSGPRGAGT
jgi:dTDP-glucose 4,6-dehydratase